MALTSITVANGATIEGRLLARNGNVTLINDTITVPTCASTTGGGSTSVPGLPNTGLGNGLLNGIAILSGVVVVIAASLFITLRKQRAQ